MSEEKQPLKCEKCGQILNENAKFCFACGAKVVDLNTKITCPACGASVVNGLFCSECGAPFANTSAQPEKATASLAASESVEEKLEKAKTLLTLEQYARAADVYEKIIDAHPEDYRGWWGLLAAGTKNLTTAPISDDIDLALTVKNVKKLATPEEYAVCEKEFIAYLMRVKTLIHEVFEDETLMVHFTDVKLDYAKELVEARDYEKAYSVYKTVVDTRPDDYRGWWGAFTAVTEEYTKEADAQKSDPITVMQKLKRFAPSEEYTACARKFLTYLTNVETLMDVALDDAALMAEFTEVKLQRAETLLAEGDYDAAYDVYDSVTETAPDDYRGFWGKLVAKTQNFVTDEDEGAGEFLDLMASVKRLATPEDYEICKSAFVAFVKEIKTIPYVEEEEQDFEKKCAVLKKARIPFLDGVKSYESIGKQEAESFGAASAKRTADINALRTSVAVTEKKRSECEQTIESKKSKRKASIFCILVGILLAGIGIYLNGLALILLGLVAALLVGGILLGTSNTDADVSESNRAKMDLEKHRDALTAAIENDENARKAYLDAIESRAKAILLMKEKVTEIDDVAEKMQAYLDLSKEERTNLWLVSDCDVYEVDCGVVNSEEKSAIMDAAYEDEAFASRAFPVLVRCDQCANQTIVGVNILGSFERYGQVVCTFCEEKVSLFKYLNDDGTPNVEELRRGANYQRYLAYEGIENEDGEEYEEEYEDADSTEDLNFDPSDLDPDEDEEDEIDEEIDDESEELEEEYADDLDESEYDEDGYLKDADDADEQEEEETHEVYLISTGSYPQGVAKVIDDVLYCGMDEAMEYATEAELPLCLLTTSQREAEQVASRLRNAGATVEIAEL